MADDWRVIASGDSTAPPDVTLEPGQDYRVVLELPVAVPDWLVDALASALWSAVGVFVTVSGVSIAGAVVTIDLAG